MIVTANPGWLQAGSFPIRRVKNLFKLSKEVAYGADEQNVLSLTQRGIVMRDLSTNEGQFASSYENYRKVRIGDFIFNPMDLLSGYTDCSKLEGIISPAYTTLRPKEADMLDSRYYNYFFKWHYD